MTEYSAAQAAATRKVQLRIKRVRPIKQTIEHVSSSGKALEKSLKFT